MGQVYFCTMLGIVQIALFDACEMLNELVKGLFHYLPHFLESKKKILNIIHLAKQGYNDFPERYLYYFPE